MKSAAFLAAILALGAAPAVATPDPGFDAYVEGLRGARQIPGVAIAVIRDRRIVKLQGYGLADAERGRAMTADTPMNVASVSKPILGLEILRLAERGRLDLDGDINRDLPFVIDNPNVAGETVTLRQLATHTSAIIDFDAEGESPTSDRPLPLADYLQSVLTPGGARYREGRHYAAWSPGTSRECSNMGARVAGLAAQRIGGAPLARLMARDVFRPLGMTRTSWEARDYRPGELAVRYEVVTCKPGPCADGKARRLEPRPPNLNTNYPDGGVHSSAADLSRLAMAILNGGRAGQYVLVRPDTFAMMLRPQLTDPGESRQRFFWRERDGMVGHSGSDYGVFTAFYFDVARGEAVVVLINRTPDLSTESAMSELLAKIRATYFRRG